MREHRELWMAWIVDPWRTGPWMALPCMTASCKPVTRPVAAVGLQRRMALEQRLAEMSLEQQEAFLAGRDNP